MIHTKKEYIDRWIRKNRFRLPDWGTWLIGREPNTQPPETYDTSAYRILIFRLSSYRDVAVSMTHGILGQITLSLPDVFVDYGFMPSSHEADILIKGGIPPLFGTTSKRAYTDFDMIAFSNSVSQELLNLPWLLHHSGISPEFNRRISEEETPILIMGGANVQSAFAACPTRYHSGMTFTDALFLGEAEAGWTEILEFFIREKKNRTKKKKTLETAGMRFSSLHIPHTREESGKKRAILKPLNNLISLIKGPVWYDKNSLGTTSVLIDAGCPHLCMFCKEAWERRPYRTRPVDRILSDIESAKQFQGIGAVNLFSFNLSSHPDILRIISCAREKVPYVLMKSQRIDQLLDQPDLLYHQQSAGKTSFTFALEGVSQRLRSFLGKTINEFHVTEALNMVFEGPVRQIKLFLILTGHETGDDFEEHRALLETIQAIRKKHPKTEKTAFILSVAPLIPMPHTPMQFQPFPDKDCLLKGMEHMKQLARGSRMLYREGISIEEARLSLLLLFADAPQSASIFEATKNGNFLLYGASKRLSALESLLDIKWTRWAYGEKNPKDRFPWDIMTTDKEKEDLFSIYLKCRSHLTKKHPSKIISSIKKTLPQKPKTIVKHIDSLHEYWFSIETLPESAGLPVSFFQVAFARALMVTEPALVPPYLKPGPSIPDLKAIPVSGIRVFSLYFKDDMENVIKKAILELPVQYGWIPGKGPQKMTKPTFADYGLLEISGAGLWLEETENEILSQLSASSINHQILKKNDIHTTLIKGAFSGKTGMEAVIWDFNTSRLSLVVSDGEKAAGFLKKTRIPDRWKTGGHVFRLAAWLKKSPDILCRFCNMHVWESLFEDNRTEVPMCRSACIYHME